MTILKAILFGISMVLVCAAIATIKQLPDNADDQQNTRAGFIVLSCIFCISSIWFWLLAEAT